MLTVFVATFVIFALVILGMSLGYLVKRKSIQGSCGGSPRWGWRKSATVLSPATRVRNVSPARRSASSGVFCNLWPFWPGGAALAGPAASVL
ncbi:Uncharacterised protein [Klebsiella quasipneumoniae]|nr:Uncharacterised protein [Klebsiella quasipneumoniae]